MGNKKHGIATNLKGYLASLSEPFYATYKLQQDKGWLNFWNMRKFYSTVRVIKAVLKAQTDRGDTASLEMRVLTKAIQRNFVGSTSSSSRA